MLNLDFNEKKFIKQSLLSLCVYFDVVCLFECLICINETSCDCFAWETIDLYQFRRGVRDKSSILMMIIDAFNQRTSDCICVCCLKYISKLLIKILPSNSLISFRRNANR